jgi:Ca2+/Na+ antiporter
MKLSTLILIMALLSLLWGAGFILLPEAMWSMYGLTLNSNGIYVSRELGAVFFMLGVILWLARNIADSKTQRAIALGLFIGNVVGCIVTLVGQFSTGVNAMGWIGAVLYLLLALGFGYYALKVPSEAA